MERWYCEFCHRFLEPNEVAYGDDKSYVYHDLTGRGCGGPIEKYPIPHQSCMGEKEPPEQIWRNIGMRDGEPYIWWSYTPLYGGEEYILKRRK